MLLSRRILRFDHRGQVHAATDTIIAIATLIVNRSRATATDSEARAQRQINAALVNVRKHHWEAIQARFGITFSHLAVQAQELVCGNLTTLQVPGVGTVERRVARVERFVDTAPFLDFGSCLLVGDFAVFGSVDDSHRFRAGECLFRWQFHASTNFSRNGKAIGLLCNHFRKKRFHL